MQETYGNKQSIEKLWGEGAEPAVSLAPGRVNLIGEHTDYNGGYVFPIAIDRNVRVQFRRSNDRWCKIRSTVFNEEDRFELSNIEHTEPGTWREYVRGVAWALREKTLEPIEAIIEGDIPIGAGLSSSAAIEVAIAQAFCYASGLKLAPTELALLCQRAENKFVGVNCGIMDQFVSIHAKHGYAVFLDCMTLNCRLVPLDSEQARIIICNTMVHHELGDSAYNERRATCERAVKLISREKPELKSLRELKSDELETFGHLLDDVSLRRARHVTTENERVLAAIEALNRGKLEDFGRLMNESHESLKNDYEVSCSELDTMVELAREVDGCLGSRLTGAGFGGCTVNLVACDAVETFIGAVSARYTEETGIEPEIYVCIPSDGARVAP